MKQLRKRLFMIALLLINCSIVNIAVALAPEPPFTIQQNIKQEVTIALAKPITDILRIGTQPFPELSYKKVQGSPDSVLFGVSFSYKDTKSESRPVYITLLKPHFLSDKSGIVSLSELEMFQLRLSLGEQVQGNGSLAVALYEAIPIDNQQSTGETGNVGTTTGGTKPMTFYSDKAGKKSTYGRQISNMLIVNVYVGL